MLIDAFICNANLSIADKNSKKNTQSSAESEKHVDKAIPAVTSGGNYCLFKGLFSMKATIAEMKGEYLEAEKYQSYLVEKSLVSATSLAVFKTH